VKTFLWENKLLTRDILSFAGSKRWNRVEGVDSQRVVHAPTLRTSLSLASRVQSKRVVDHPALLDEPIIPSLWTETNWRGLLVDKSTQAFQIAEYVIERARQLTLATVNELDISDKFWLNGEQGALPRMLSADKEICCKSMQLLAEETLRILQAQPILVKVSKPAKVFGDIHGQLRDLLLLFREYGYPSNLGGDVDSVSYVFDGDIVDRGTHDVEV